ncbi:MAG: xanthine dehydrogenase family protein subunit M [Chloroflexi bacterium]|nr:xanthine dehydrogenase family protein subunit M [Chloroflexota bacterium]
MTRFDYVRPSTVAEAVGLLEAHGDDALAIAGGTATVLLLQKRMLRPELVVDLGGLPGLTGVEQNGGGLRIGALTPIRAIERDAIVRGTHHLLAEAASQVAGVRVRNAATVGGSVCFGEPQTDLPPALLAMNATATIAGSQGSRDVPLEEFFLGPYETAREQGEVLTHLSVPTPVPGSGGCHVKFTMGSPENKPVANVSALVTVDASTRALADVRIVMGAVGGVPMLAHKANDTLKGERPSDALIAQAAVRASEEADPVEDLRGSVWYKRRIIKVLVERALRCAIERAN